MTKLTVSRGRVNADTLHALVDFDVELRWLLKREAD
jgi:hypothetical protein